MSSSIHQSTNEFNAEDYQGGHFNKEDLAPLQKWITSRGKDGPRTQMWTYHTPSGPIMISTVAEAKIALAISQQTAAAAPAAAVTPETHAARQNIAEPFADSKDPRVRELANINSRLAILREQMAVSNADESPDRMAEALAQDAQDRADVRAYAQAHTEAGRKAIGVKSAENPIVTSIQSALNVNRKSAHKKLIKVDGLMGPETEHALQEQFGGDKWKKYELKELALVMGGDLSFNQ